MSVIENEKKKPMNPLQEALTKSLHALPAKAITPPASTAPASTPLPNEGRGVSGFNSGLEMPKKTAVARGRRAVPKSANLGEKELCVVNELIDHVWTQYQRRMDFSKAIRVAVRCLDLHDRRVVAALDAIDLMDGRRRRNVKR